VRPRVGSLAAALAFAWAGNLSAQEKPTGAPSPIATAVQPRLGALPADLVPPASSGPSVSHSPSIQAGAGPVPVLFAIFGGIAGMFVGRWWMQRGCDENCDERGFIGLLAGGLFGGVIGWMVGGGEMTDPGPPRRGLVPSETYSQ
jgi:hypothetical protein